MNHSVNDFMKKNYLIQAQLLIIFTLTFFISDLKLASAQQKSDPELLKISNTSISKSTFEKIYRKNNNKDNAGDKKSIEEYLELFINYKLKVREAEDLKLDTSISFKNELQNYRKQLAQPYLTDKDVSEKLMREAYDRLKKDVRASHILVKLNSDALPKDTLAAYNRVLSLVDRIKKGEDFNKVAREVSDDPSVKDNGGDLGYFTALLMVYPFENAAYNTKPGDLSRPVRTKFGYHLIKVTDVRPAMGQYRVAHIMVKSPKTFSPEDTLKAKTKIDEIYQKIKNGEKFEDLAIQFSDDQGSAKKGGELPVFGTGRMVPEFERASVSLKNDGDISEPIRTAFGWHIIKRIEKKDIGSFEEMQSELKTKISRDSRSELSRNALINKIQKEYSFTEFNAAKEEVFSGVDSSYLAGKWNSEKYKNADKPVFKMLDKNYTQKDFAKFLYDHQSKKTTSDLKTILKSNYDKFVNESCINLKESRLELEYPDFKSLMEEYRDGILLFELTDKKVWTRAVKDSIGLTDFYSKNKNNYLWDERVDASVYSCSSSEIAAQVKTLLKKDKITDEQIKEDINKNSQLDLNVTSGIFSKGENDYLDGVKWVKGITEEKPNGKSIQFANIKDILAPQPKSLDDAKGLVTADYQTYLEKEWIDQLRKKYKVSVNNDVLSTIQ